MPSRGGQASARTPGSICRWATRTLVPTPRTGAPASRSPTRTIIGSASRNFRRVARSNVREGPSGDPPGLVDRLRAGEARAFEELVRAYQHRVFGVAVRMLGNRAEAEDIAQEVFLRVHRSVGEFRGQAKLSTWLYAIASRLCLNRLASGERHRVREGEETLMRLPSADSGPADALE